MEFKNIGGATAYDVLTEVFSSSSDIEFKNTSILTEEVEAGETFTVKTEFTVSPSVLVGSVFEIMCSSNADYASCQTVYEMKVGLLGENFETADFTANDWKIEGKGIWVIDSLNAYEGKYCIKSDNVDNNQYAKLKIQIEVLADGPLTFYVKTSSEKDYDILEFYVNSMMIEKWSGEKDWEPYTYEMKKGTYALEWRYRKDTSGSAGEDRAYIDNIFFPPVSASTLMDAVSNLKYNISEGQLNLKWEAVENADEYIVRRDGEIVSTQTETSFNESVLEGIVTYSVVAKNQDNYSAPAFVVVNSDVNNSDNIINVENNKVSLYPNPTSGMIYVELDNTFDAVIYNYQGQVVMREYDNNGQIDLSNLSAGMYFVEIREGNNRMIGKVIVK